MSSPEAGSLYHDGGVRGAGNFHLALSRADGFYQNHVKPGGIEDVDRLVHAARQAAQTAPAGHTAHKHAGVAGQLPHADAVAQNSPAGKGAGRVYGDNGHGFAGQPVGFGQFVDHARFSGAGRAGHAHQMRPPGAGVQVVEHRLGFGSIVFYPGDEPGHSTFVVYVNLSGVYGGHRLTE